MNSIDDVWNKVLDIMGKDLPMTAFDTWFNDCNAVKFSDNRLFIHTPSEFKKNVIEDRYAERIKSALSELFAGDIDIVVLDDAGLSSIVGPSIENDYSFVDEYTFEQFVVGSSNKFAHAAAKAVAEGKQKQSYNPLFIYGESGLGKTHLLHAIRHSISGNFPHYNIVFVKGDDFTNEMIQAIQLGNVVEFRNKYRGADLFLIDDIQFIAGKISTQEEFFNTFNTLYEHGKQIVFTSDRPPSEIHTLEDRLRGRFESGLIADIQPPDDALRIAIIRSKSEQMGVILPDDVTNHIANSLSSNVRQLEGAVKMILAYRDMLDGDINVKNVSELLKKIFIGARVLLPTVETIIEETAKYYMLKPEDLKGDRRTQNVALARHISIFLIRDLTNLSLKDIGDVIGRDHTTVMSSIKRVNTEIENSQEFSNIIKDIKSNIISKN